MKTSKVREALALMNSMILSGESHSETSHKAYEDAMSELYPKTASSHNSPLTGRVEMEEPVMIQEAHFKDGILNISATHPLFAVMAEEAARLLKDFGGKNYASFRMVSKELGELVVDVRYAEGMMPAEKAAKLGLRVAALESSLSRAQEGLEEWVSRSEFAVRVLQRVRADLNDRNFQTEAGAAVEVIKKAITSYRLATEDTKPESKQENKP